MPEGLYEKGKRKGKRRTYTPEEIESIKHEYESGVAAHRIAKKFGVSHHTILKLIRKDQEQSKEV
jgi:transposase-like protein